MRALGSSTMTTLQHRSLRIARGQFGSGPTVFQVGVAYEYVPMYTKTWMLTICGEISEGGPLTGFGQKSKVFQLSRSRGGYASIVSKWWTLSQPLEHCCDVRYANNIFFFLERHFWRSSDTLGTKAGTPPRRASNVLHVRSSAQI